ncbi:MAG TPA: hypothetical protein VF194_07220 [Ferrovibrio sp.]|uniref:hypothetical protein n=1 Tax=Ferrovibrio sp. TaxID=1917215 RepID=UPI002ED08620
MRARRSLLLTAAGLVLPAGLLCSPPAAAFCVANDGSIPLSIRAGGPPMPIYVRPNLAPGRRDCYVPRKPTGIVVEIFDATNGRLRCRQSVPPKNSTIIVGKTCRVQLD